MPRRRKALQRALNVGTVVVVAAILTVFALKTVSLISCWRLTAATRDAGEAALAEGVTADAILAARAEMLRVARAHGVQRPVVRAAIERRAAAQHVVVLELCARSCHPTIERPLPVRLTSEELARLDEERIGEHTGDRWRHHHD